MKTQEKNVAKLLKEFDINNLKPVVLIYGKENFLKKSFVDKIKNIYNENLHFLWGDEVDIGTLKDIFSGSNLFSEGEIAVIWDIDQLISNLNKEQLNQFINLIKNIKSPNKIILISLKDKIPKKEPYKTLLTISDVITSQPLSSKAFFISVKKKIQKEGINIDDDTLLYLVSKLKNDLYYAKQEVEKLIIFTKEKGNITTKDIDQIVNPKIEESIFEFINMFFKKDKKVIDIYTNLVQTSHHTFEIQSMVLTYINRILLLKTLQKQNLTEENIFSKIRVTHPFMKANLKKLASLVEEEELIELIKQLYQLEIKQKVNYEDLEESFKEFIVKWLG